MQANNEPTEAVEADEKLAEKAYGKGYEWYRNKWIGDHVEMCADLVRSFIPRPTTASVPADALVEELRQLHEAARGCEFDLVPADGPIARLALFMHQNGDGLLAALSTNTPAISGDRMAMALVIENCEITFGGVRQTKLGKKIAAALRATPVSDGLREAVNTLIEKLRETSPCDLANGKCGVPNFGTELEAIEIALLNEGSRAGD